MADIQKMLEQKEKLQEKIKEEKKREYEKFGDGSSINLM